MHRRSIGALTAAFLLASAVSASANDKVRFVLDWFPAGYIGFTHIGVKHGFFAAEGLDVTIDIGRGGSDAVTRVATGTDDFGGASLSALMTAAANSPMPAKAVMAVYSKSPDAIVTKADSGINSIKDLSHKTLATATFSGSNQVWPLIAKSNGLDISTVKLLKVDDNAVGPMLASGNADAVISWMTSAPLYTTLVAPSGAKLKVLAWSDFGLAGYNWSIMASDRMIKEHPETVARFLRAYKKSVEYVMEHPEESGKDLHEMVPNTDAATNTAEIIAMKPLIRNEISERTGLGAFEPALVAESWKWVAGAQGFPLDKIDPQSVIDRSFVPKS
ncbi:ABC transporter substrate-binding protein [Beijerinckia sp. L45]|uniref:ABC transporter substrate-binding protein n=1 Tax=Beijerinckia sp. L45 TaxID=1641855 RepID=UPI00131C9EF1|nr:ABC transporter substrate-binding protein [Beijerinckia sp. L45]